MTLANVDSDAEASQLIDFSMKFHMAQKHLTIVNPTFNVGYLQNKTINFDVMVHHLGPGANDSSYPSIQLTAIYLLQTEKIEELGYAQSWGRHLLIFTIDCVQRN